MALHKEITLPNGAVGRYHQIVKIESGPNMSHLEVRVGSWPSYDWFLQDKPPVWSHYIEVPIGNLYTAVEDVVKVTDPFTGSSTSLDLTSMDLLKLKDKKWFELKIIRDQKEFGGFVWNTHTFDSDSQAQSRIQGAVQLAMIAASNNTSFSIDWTLQDNSVITLSGSDMIAVGLALAQHVEGVHAIGRDLRAQIEACTTTQALDAINWPTP